MENTQNRKMCRLCSESLEDNEFEELSQFKRDMLDIILPELTSNIKLNTSVKTFICATCSKHIIISYEFKRCSLENNTSAYFEKSETIPLEHLDDVLSEQKPPKPPVKQEDFQENCCLCHTAIKENIVNSACESYDVLNMLEKCFPELDNHFEAGSRLCEKCFDSLEKMFTFINSCLAVKEKIRYYESFYGDHKAYAGLHDVKDIKMEPEDIKDQMELNNVIFYGGSCDSAVKFQPKCENDDSCEENGEKSYHPIEEIKLEESKETEDISCEQGDPLENGGVSTQHPKQYKVKYKCALCHYESINKKYLRKHMLRHQAPSQVTMFKCEPCEFETKHKTSLTRHMLRHKDSSRHVGMYKCELCEFKTKHKASLRSHMPRHKNRSQATMYNCDLCEYKYKHKCNVKTTC